MARILVTGGTGFIGKHFLAAVHDTHDVIATYRNVPGNERVTWVSCDLSNTQSVEQLRSLGPIDIIVHIGGSSPNRAYLDGHYRATTTGTHALVSIAKTLGVKRIIYLSSIVVDFPYEGPYRSSKLIGEKLVRESGIDYVILRPETVIGPGARDFTRIARASRYLLPLIGSGTNLVQPVAVSDLINLITRALHDDTLLGRTLPVVGPEALPLRVLLARAALASGNRPAFLPLPKPLVKAASHVAQTVTPLLGLNNERVHIITQHRTYAGPRQTTPVNQMLSFLSRR